MCDTEVRHTPVRPYVYLVGAGFRVRRTLFSEVIGEASASNPCGGEIMLQSTWMKQDGRYRETDIPLVIRTAFLEIPTVIFPE